MSNQEKLSAIVICKNEEKNIHRCLKSLNFVDEVILVDSGSTDSTLNIAKTFKNVKIFETEWLGYSETKEWAVTKAQFDWILWIDSDEAVSEDLENEWKTFSTKIPNIIGAISIFRKTFFLGHFVGHSGWYPETVIRFFHKERAQFNGKVLHEGLIVNSKYAIHKFSSYILHYSYHSLAQYFTKMISYGYLGAQELVRRDKKISMSRIIFSPLWTFIKSYFFQRGIMHGLIGLTICIGSAFSSFIKYTNYFFIKKFGYVENIKKEER